jgi:hypothetical protein
MRKVIVLQAIVLLLVFLTENGVAQQTCERPMDCDACLDRYGCFFCEDYGCMSDDEANRLACINESNSQVLRACPTNDCLPPSPTCAGCLPNLNEPQCYLNHTEVNENEFCDFYLSYYGFRTIICQIDPAEIHSAIFNSQNTVTRNFDKPLPITLTRNQLHIVTSYDVCGSHSMTGTNNYYPSVILIHVEFQLNYHVKDLAVFDYSSANYGSGAQPAKLSMLSSNATNVELEYLTSCNKTAPVEPNIYIMNHNGMLVVGINSKTTPFNVIANQHNSLDDENVSFSLRLVADPAIRMEFSIVLLLCSFVAILLM